MGIVALFDAVSKTVQRPGLIGVAAVDKESGAVAFQAESEVDIVAVTIGNVVETELVEFVVDVGVGVLEHMFFALENTEGRRAETARSESHREPPASSFYLAGMRWCRKLSRTPMGVWNVR